MSAPGQPVSHTSSTAGTIRQLGAYVTGCSFDQFGFNVAWAAGDGTIHLASRGAPDDWQRIEAHDGAVLCLSASERPAGFISGGDDGRFLRIFPDGRLETIRDGGKWVEHVAATADDKSGWFACAIGRQVHLFNDQDMRLKTLDHPSTVTGLAFDKRGKRLACSHYDGASLWFTMSKSDKPRIVEWKGSHTGVILHPAGDVLVTAMQENALHGWRLTDGQHMRMSGYPGKIDSMSFTRTGKYLASSGADSIILWPFFGGGPMGKAPLELAQMEGVLCTRVACHPRLDVVAAGYTDGRVVIADIASGSVSPVSDGGPGAISALAWSPQGELLAYGTEAGSATLVNPYAGL